LKSLEICRRAGVPVAYGSDLLGQLQVDQSREFRIRHEVVPAIEIIRSATTIAAKVLRHEGKLGCLAPDAFADLIVIDGDPLRNIDLLAGQGEHIPLIMKDGKLHKNALH
jgi:imidazolonepropionase-like amidohydrolase